MKSVLAISAVYKAFGDNAALAGASFDLHANECLGLLGPNGAGKSTLVRAIAGRVRLDAGDIAIHGTSTTGAQADIRNQAGVIGVVPQEIALYSGLTAGENLHIFGALNGLRGAVLAERITWALDWSGLQERRDDRVKDFSGGMQRRLNVACGVLHRPGILILDEPTVGVDPQSRAHIWDMLAELREHGTALLLTTHQLDEAQKVCERIVIIDHGKVIANGSFDELLQATIGSQRQVICHFDAPLPADTHIGELNRLDDHRLMGRVDNVPRELPAILGAIEDAGLSLDDLAIQPPGLQAVFLHLTGRELRE